MKMLLPAIAVALLFSCAHPQECHDQVVSELTEAYREGRITEEKYIELRMKQTFKVVVEKNVLDSKNYDCISQH